MIVRRPRARWVHPDTHRIFKFLPHNPPRRGDVVMVDDERCRIARCPLKRDGRAWELKDPRGIKVRPA